MSQHRSRLVALVLPTIANPIFAETVQAASDELAGDGCQLLLGLSGYAAEREEALVETILSRRPDGIILTGTLHSEATRRRLLDAGIPVVETWDMTPSPIDMLVGISHEAIGHAIAGHLLEHGYRKIAILAVDDPRGQRRNQALMAALAGKGATVLANEVMAAPASFQLGREGAGQLLDNHKGLDMIVCSSDTLAHGALTEAVSRGLHVPGDIGIMGFGDLELAPHTNPPLSTVRVDGALIGKLAAQAILDRINGAPARTGRVTDIGFALVHRETT